MSVQSENFAGVAFVGRTIQSIQELTGFNKKRHSVPRIFDDFGNQFVADVAGPDVEHDLEDVYQKLKHSFGFKRVELRRSTPAPGCGCIETPYFVYDINATQSADNPAAVIWQRSIIKIVEPDQVVSAPFAAVFDNKFDRIEFTFAQAVDLERWIDHVESLEDERLFLNYDSRTTRCQMEISGVDASIEVNETTVSVAHKQKTHTGQILASFVEVKNRISETFAN